MLSATRDVLPSPTEHCLAGQLGTTRGHVALACGDMYVHRQDILELQSHEAQGFQIYEDMGREEQDGEKEVEGGDEEWVEHRSLQQHISGSVCHGCVITCVEIVCVSVQKRTLLMFHPVVIGWEEGGTKGTVMALGGHQQSLRGRAAVAVTCHLRRFVSANLDPHQSIAVPM